MSTVARSALCRNVGVRAARSKFPPLRSGGGFIQEVGLAPAGWRTGLEGRRLLGSVAASSTTPSETSTSTPPPPPPPSEPLRPTRSFTRILAVIAISTLCFTAGFVMAAAPVLSDGIDTATAVLEPPTDEQTMTMYTPPTAEAAAIEKQIFEHPLTKALLADPKYIASRPHLKIPEKMRKMNLTAGTLLGPNMIEVPTLQFSTADGSELVALQYLGSSLCGHPGMVHGGLLATLLDEGTARCCFPALPNKIAVTASLKIEYKKPTMAGQIVVLRAHTTKVEGRKAWVVGRLETLVDEGKGEVPVVLVESEALFIEPKQAAQMKRIVPV